MNILRAKRLATRYLSRGKPTFLWGAPGIGKSDIAREIAAESYDGNMVDFRAILRDPVDLRGLPTISGDTAKWLAPDDLPQEARDGERGVLLMDELNAAPPAMQAACFGLVLDRRVGSYELPVGWEILAAGNRQSDRAAAQRMPSALANRFAHIDLEASVEDFVTWGNDPAKGDLSPMMIAFIRFRPALIHDMSSSDLRAFPSPRSWASANEFVDDAEEDRADLIAGLVGPGAGAEFESFIRVYKDLPSLDYILANPTSAPLVKEQSAKFAVTAGLARKVTATSINNAMVYVERLKAREFSIMFMIDAVKRDPGLSHTNAFTAWAMANRDVTFN